jgi:hypothetical protein
VSVDDWTYQRVGKIPKGLDERHIVIDAHHPRPTRKDIQNGSIERYFARQVNQPNGEITEISKQTYDRLKTNAFYLTAQLTWRITGKKEDIAGPNTLHGPTRTYTGVTTSNRVAVEEADRQLPGMRNRLRNYSQYWYAM